MPSSLFQFELRPLDQVQPWGAPEDPNLHWFGLTDGEYWIQAGEHTLFEYSATAQAQSGVSRFCDYQVVRLYEDVVDLAPYALEPVPAELRRYIALDESRPLNHHLTKWRATMDEAQTSEDDVERLYEANHWIGCRSLDSAYLTPSTHIIAWSDPDDVRIEWDNRGKRLNGVQAWSAQHGSWRIPRAAFVSEVLDFHERLMAHMAQRVSQVMAGALSRNIRVDLEGLRREQHARSQSIQHLLGQPAHPTDWSGVTAAIRSLEARAG